MGEGRIQATLLAKVIAGHNPVRAIDVSEDELDPVALGFRGIDPSKTVWPAYQPMVPLLGFQLQIKLIYNRLAFAFPGYFCEANQASH